MVRPRIGNGGGLGLDEILWPSYYIGGYIRLFPYLPQPQSLSESMF